MSHTDPADRAAWENEQRELAARERRAALIERGLIRLAELRPDWYDRAACKGNTEIMFDVVDTARALAICRICEVREPCRAQARKNREQGTWGGETELDRHKAGRGAPVNVNARQQARRDAETDRKRRYRARQQQASG